MSQLFIVFPGIIGLLIFVYRRSPFPSKEYLLLLYPPIVGVGALYISALITNYLKVSDFHLLTDIGLLFLKMDDAFLSFCDADSRSFFDKGTFALSVLVASVFSYIAKRLFNLETLFNPAGLDFIDFTKKPLSLIELQNGKVYVGKVTQAPHEAGAQALLTMVVVMSGERVRSVKPDEAGVLNYTTFYDPKDVHAEDTTDLRLSIALRYIVSIRAFDFEAFERFLNDGKAILTFPLDKKP